jgi:S1-C subfamily serine protease
MKLPIGQIDKSVQKEYLQDKLKTRKILFFVFSLSVPLFIGIMQTYAAKYTKPETSKSITTPVADVSTGTSTGTAFLTGKNTLLTAKHVVEDVKIGGEVKLIFMELKPQITTTAIVKWKCSDDGHEMDFAVLKLVAPSVLPEGMPILILGDSDLIVQNEEIKAIGYPAGMFSFTKGIVSSPTVRDANGEYDLIKIDIAIHPGNSGGPIILSETEEVIGLAESGLTGRFKGINFASKINRFIEAAEKDGIDIYE